MTGRGVTAAAAQVTMAAMSRSIRLSTDAQRSLALGAFGRFDAKEDGMIEGWAMKFGVPLQVWGKAIFEKGDPDPFMLEGRSPGEILMLAYHNKSRPLGVYASLEVRPEGLWAEGQITGSTRDGQEMRALISEGIVTGFSVEGRVTKDRFERLDGPENPKTWILMQMMLREISCVTFPACDEARIAASYEAALEAHEAAARREVERQQRIEKSAKAWDDLMSTKRIEES